MYFITAPGPWRCRAAAWASRWPPPRSWVCPASAATASPPSPPRPSSCWGGRRVFLVSEGKIRNVLTKCLPHLYQFAVPARIIYFSRKALQWFLPVPRFSLTPPRKSWCPILSWSHTASSRLLSASSSMLSSSQVKVWSQRGEVVFLHTPVFCFPRLWLGSKYLQLSN